MANRRITIFGASGFVGRHIVRRLGARWDVVCAAVRHPERAGFLRTMGVLGQIVPMRASILDDAGVEAAVANADAVINLVAVLHESGRDTFEAVHREGAARVARAAKAAGAQRLVHVSAIGADPDSPAAYGRTKAAGEEAVRAAFPEATIMRPSIVFGPEDHFFNRFAAMAQISPALPLIGGGHTRFQPVYVADVAEAVVKALDDPGTRGRTYELGGPRIYTFRELMELMLKELNRRRLLVPVPFPIAALLGAILQYLPNPPLTRDQVRMLQVDNVVSPEALTLQDLGISPTTAEVVIPTYLARFRRRGGVRRPLPG
jgi:uncharacterized protein YbjT (DUF2867 family)